MVLIEPLTEETVTPSGIILVDKVVKRKPKKGLVIKAGAVLVAEGETVLYPHGIGNEVQLDGKDYLLIKATDIWLVV